MRRVLSVIVLNEHGVLSRIVGLFQVGDIISIA